jgi:hypothetical protein
MFLLYFAILTKTVPFLKLLHCVSKLKYSSFIQFHHLFFENIYLKSSPMITCATFCYFMCCFV